MSQSNKINPNYLDDLIFTSDGGIAINMKTFLKRPSVQEKIRRMGRIAEREIAKRQARMKQEQNGGSAAKE